jgi:hypothetical protein
MKKEYLINLGIQVNTKREAVFDENNIWVDTKPKHVIDFGGQESSILEILDRELKIMKHSSIELRRLIRLYSYRDTAGAKTLDRASTRIRYGDPDPKEERACWNTCMLILEHLFLEHEQIRVR